MAEGLLVKGNYLEVILYNVIKVAYCNDHTLYDTMSGDIM